MALFLSLASLGCAGSSSVAGPGKLGLPRERVALRIDPVAGEALMIGSLRGRVVLITVITTWAETAHIEIPRIKALVHSTDPKDFAVVAIALDQNREMVRIFAQAFDIPYVVGTVSDPAELTSYRGPLGPIHIIPTSVLLDREGRIAARMDGVWPDGVLEEAVRRLVASDRASH